MMMMMSSCLLLLLISALSSIVESVPKSLVKRQVDTSNIPDDVLIECFAILAEGGTCDNLLGGSPVTVPPVTESPGCRCVPQWQCLDFNNPSANTVDGGLLTLVNVRTTCPDAFETCCINIDFNAVAPAPPPAPRSPTCGQLKPEGVVATLLGFEENQAQFGQFPWMAAVMTTGIAGSQGANVYVCGGSLIHPRVILTAAHYMNDKVNSPQQLAVRLGEWDFKLPTEPIVHQDIRVQRIAIHPQFVTNQLTYDVALLFLESDAILGPTVSPICLPDPFETFDGESCYTSGWGKDIFGQTGRYQQILKSLRMPAVNHGQCENSLKTTRLGQTFRLHNSFMCAGGNGVDACTGDGGSPLVCPKKFGGGYVQAGVVAWGIGCGQPGIPGVFASVSEAVQWIGQELLTNMNFDIRGGF